MQHASGPVSTDSARLSYDEQLRRAPDDAQRHVFRGLALAYLGRKADVIAAGERGTQLLPVSRDASDGAYLQHQRARIYPLVGEREQAMGVLERLLAMPHYLSPSWLNIDPNFACVRGDPRFERMIAGC